MLKQQLQALRAEDPLELVWHALSDPTRRAMLDLLRARPRTTGELAEAFPLSRFAVMKHLDVLVAVGLVIARREGRERWNSLNPVPLQQLVERWVRPYEALWSQSLVRFKARVEHQSLETSMDTLNGAGRANAGVLTTQLEIPIQAPPSHVWRALIEDVHSWWPKDFYASHGPATMRFDARLGGQLVEQTADGGGVVWYTVIALAPGKSVDLAGHLSVAFGGPAGTMLRLGLREQGTQTVLEVTDAVVGRVNDRTAATLEEGWRTVFEGGLKAHAERTVQA